MSPMHVRTLRIPVAAAVAAVLLTLLGPGCGPSEPSPKAPGAKIKAVATIGMITDIVREVGGDRVEADGLMAPGVDPHLYKPGEGDVRRLSGADVIFYNGLGLEGKMGELFERMAARKPTVAVTEGLDPKQLRSPPEFEGHADPHVWFDVKLWMHAVGRVEQALAKLDPEHAAEYRSRAEAYLRKLEELDAYARSRIASIPKERRVLVTAHDAFGYFGRAYDIEVAGLQGVSTETDFGPADVKRLADLLTARKVKAIFVESSVPKRSIEAVQAATRAGGHEVAVGGELFSDALGDAGTEAGTYVGMVRHNVDTIVKALK